MEKKERNIKIAVFAAIAGIAALSVILFSPRVSRANFLDDIVNFLKNNSSSTAVETQTPPADISTPVSLYKPALDYEEAVIRAVDVSSKSVVSIVISKDLPVIENCPVNPFGDLPREFQDFFGGGFDFFGQCQTGTKKQEVGGGSGFIVSEDGLIVTNRHVVSDKNAEYTVLTNDGKKYDAKVLAQDSINDLAIIKITATGLSAAKLGDSDSIKLGQTAIAIGNALGEFRNTVSVGVISGLARNITASGGNGFLETIQGVIQTDAAINQGNSGGPHKTIVSRRAVCCGNRHARGETKFTG
ncbi:MAG: peptidase S1 and S6 chymotrypsin/Hap [Candidatus Jorgensenbacteria bacterium GW2011_GWA2_45_9]|uniref:Peptidase S1 and S6 chymotrypsin/Hap n=1 Tax=Candidatus Jorgensenbacteria bacterium GW2011_GWA2_45_9 TaxID=1618663 RepID=A0A0G1R0R5_9BACT|nr:MAG: peptidase S1 and S6 chymotrypsin/Hap [Candidatus Jorgensenbacteria bacterium GW2011_GWA2_45_9]